MILDGKKVADTILLSLQKKIDQIQGRKPGLAFILVGEHLPSFSYVKMKTRACKALGIKSHVFHLAEEVSEKELLDNIDTLNENKELDGIIVQQPLPKHINPIYIMNAVSPSKDVDGFHPINLGKLILGEESGFIPCTPLGILTLLDNYEISLPGKHVVILGRSTIVGKPLAILCMQKHPLRNATVTLAHSATKNLSNITQEADILISAVGAANTVTKDMVKKGAVVIDVGINRIYSPSKKPTIVGDVDFIEVQKKASAISPVPKGIGPMTIAMLMKNTYTSFVQKQRCE